MDSNPAPQDAELRLALGMRGGVSLAVWIGGACAEIDELRRAHEDRSGFWWEVLKESPYSKVVVDVMAGASAGGLNGVLFAAAIRHGFPMSDLLRVWKDVGGISKLRRREEPWLSFLNGDEGFLDVIRDLLVELVPDPGEDAPADQPGCYVDLQLSATLIDPVDQPTVSPGDEKLRRSRSTARFHFRHDPAAVPARRDLERADLARLAVAARATASFPMAFEAAAVRSTRPATFEVTPQAVPKPGVLRPADRAEAIAALPPDERAAARARLRLVDCRGVFSESRGTPKAATAGFTDEDFVVADGGIVDNIPLGKAIDAIRDAPAEGPTRRVLVYLHPTGPAGIVSPAAAGAGEETIAEREARRRGPMAMVSGLIASRLQGESIDGDLEQLEDHNRSVRLRAALRQSVLDELSSSRQLPVKLARNRLSSYLAQRGGADAVAIQRLLRDPLGVLGEDPFPQAPERGPDPDDRWRSPLARWTPEQRMELDGQLRGLFVNKLQQRPLGIELMKGGLGPVSRSITLLLELVREGEKENPDDPQLGLLKAPLYRLASLVREMDRYRMLGWVAAAGSLRRDGDLDEWLEDTRGHLNAMLQCDPDVNITLCRGEVEGREFDDAYDSFFGQTAGILEKILAGAPAPPKTKDRRRDVRRAIINRLEEISEQVLPLLDPPQRPPKLKKDDPAPPPRSGAEVTQRVLLEPKRYFSTRLAVLEVLLHQEQVVGGAGGVEISFARMSAAAPIIGATRFTQLHTYSLALNPEFTKDGDHLVPDVKLAGNELGSFSAFLDEEWRVNDWMWGRLDAVATLVDLLLGEDRPAAERPPLSRFDSIPDRHHESGPSGWELAGYGTGATDPGREEPEAVRRALIARRQGEILQDATAEHLPADPAEWTAGLETLVRPGSPDLAAQAGEVASAAARVLGAALPRSVPRIVGQLDGVARRVARRFSKPKGGLAPLPVAIGAVPPAPAAEPATARYRRIAVVTLVGTIVAALVWAVADHPLSLGIGLVVGLAVALVPGVVLLWLAVQRPRDAAARTTPKDP